LLCGDINKKGEHERSMKNKIVKILGVVLTLALLSSLAIIASPVVAAPGQNTFGKVTTPTVRPNTGVGVMAIAPDGTIFAAVVEGADPVADTEPYGWTIYKSTDDGYSWTATTLTSDILDSVTWDEPTDIVISPNYDEDKTFYVSTYNANIYRMEDAGTTYPQLLKSPVDSWGHVPNRIYDMDLWYDGSEVWILIGTDYDVLVMEDTTFAPWLDQELMPGEDVHARAYEVAFAPDFDETGLIWAVVEDGGDFMVTGTYSPGQWGWVFQDLYLEDQDSTPINASRYVDIAFPSWYSTNSDPVFYIGCSDTSGMSADGNICLVQIATVASGQDSECTPLLPEDDDIVSIEVSGDVILAGTLNNNNSGVLYRSDNLGDTFEVAAKLPTGEETFNVYMGADVVWGGEIFDPQDGMAFCTSRGPGYDESAISVSEDGGQTWNQIAWIDTDWDETWDMAFSPYTSSQPAFILSSGFGNDSLWRTNDITAKSPQWVRVWSEAATDYMLELYDVEYSLDGSCVMLEIQNNDSGDREIWKSTDNGQIFSHWRTLPENAEHISDWIVFDGSTIYSANWVGNPDDYGFYGTSRFGPATKSLKGEALESIALQPGFDSNDTDNQVMVVGTEAGSVFISLDAGRTWGAEQSVTGSSEDVYVAFDMDFATNGLIYFCTEDGVVGKAQLDGNKFKSGSQKGVADDKYGTEIDDSLEVFSGIWVSPDNTLYIMGGNVDSQTLYSYNMDGMVTVVGQNAVVFDDASAQIKVQGTYTAQAMGFVDLGGAEIENTLGVFIDGEALQVIGDNLTAVAADTLGDGYIQVMGVTSGATGSIFVPEQALDDLYYEETVDVISSNLFVDLPHMDTLSFSNEDLDGDFVDNEDLVVIGYNLVGNSGGYVDGAITVQGVTSGTIDTINVTNEGTGSVFDEEEVVVITGVDLAADQVSNLTEPTEDMSCYRLLLHESKNVWESRSINGAWRMWGTTGSNYIWTIVNWESVYAMQDTLSGPVTGVTVSNVSYTSANVSWNMMTGAKQFEVKYDSTTVLAPSTPASSPALTTKLSSLEDLTDYSVMVRVYEGQAFQSRWSTAVDFTTLETIASPCSGGAAMVPYNGLQGAPINPSFVWGAVDNAVEYEFVLSANSDLSNPIVDTTIDAPTTAYTCTVDLAYDTNHYWKVRAVSDTGTKSAWCGPYNFHTRTEAIPPVTVEPAPTPTIVLPQPTVTVNVPDITLPQPTVTVIPPPITIDVPAVVTVTQQPAPTIVLPVEEPTGTPVYIWIIVGIGAILTIAVIVLIIRTRRVV